MKCLTSDFTDEESQLMEVIATVVEKEPLINHQNTPLKISDSSITSLALVSKFDEPLAESSAEITDQSLALPKGVMIQARCHSKSRFFLNTLQDEMINKVLGPGAPDERITNGYGIVLQKQDFWTLNMHLQMAK